MKNVLNEIFKRTRSGKPNMEEALHIEGCVNPKIQENYNLTPKTSPVNYADMLLILKKLCRVKNKFCPFRSWHSGKYEGITCSIVTRCCVLSGIQNIQSKGDPSACRSINI